MGPGRAHGVDDRAGIEVLVTEVGPGGALATTTTDRDGRFTVEGMPEGPARALVRARIPGARAVIDQ